MTSPPKDRQDSGTDPEPTWRCFHCDEVFADKFEAEIHFGRSEHFAPMCLVDAIKYREMEERMRRYNDEDADLHRQIARMESDHRQALMREEEKGYARGLKDGAALSSSPQGGAEPPLRPVKAKPRRDGLGVEVSMSDGTRWTIWFDEAASPAALVEQPSDEFILHAWDIHVGDPTEKHPFTDADKLHFARAVLAAHPVRESLAEQPTGANP